MLSKSSYSVQLDPYRAGLEVAEALQEIDPEIIIVFSSIHYQGSPELPEAIYDVLANDDVLLVGCTGDGFYEQQMVANVGVSALAINSQGAITWEVASASGVGAAPYQATKECFAKLQQQAEARLYLLFSDFRTDASEVIRAANESISAPIVGGMAGDNFAMEHCFLYKGRQVLTDSVVAVALHGDFNFNIISMHNTTPTGKMGLLTSCEGTTIHTINDLPAMHFVEEAMGKPLDYIDRGTITGNVINKKNPQVMRHRSLLLSKTPLQDTSIQLFGGLEEGEQIQLCETDQQTLTVEMKEVARQLAATPFSPQAALVVSCAGRKQIMGNQNSVEVTALAEPGPLPPALAGFPSLGEIGPVRLEDGYSPSLFHNMTYVLLLLG